MNFYELDVFAFGNFVKSHNLNVQLTKQRTFSLDR